MMKLLKYFIFAAVILPLELSLSKEHLSFNLILDKEEYLKGEKIMIGLEVTNNKKLELGVYQPRHHVGVEFKLFDADGDEVRYTGPTPFFGDTPPLLSVKPGESLFWVEELNQLYGYLISMASAHQIIEVGTYTIRAIYRSGIGDILTAESRFSIVEPTGGEAVAYRKFMDILYEARGGGEITSTEELIMRLLEIEREHPKSVYTPIVLNIVGSKYYIWLRQEAKAIEVYQRLVQNHPDVIAGYRGILNHILSKMRDDDERKQFFKQLERDVNSRLGTRILRETKRSKGLE